MNKRLLLALYDRSGLGAYMPVNYKGHELAVEEHMEKFAELIVKECVTMCDETRADYFKHRKAADDYTDKNIYAEGEAASDIIKYKMKKHFGVNE